MGGERYSPFEEGRGDGSKRSKCREPDVGLSFSRRAESSLHFTGSRRVHGAVIYTEKNVPVAVIETKSPSMWQQNFDYEVE